MEADAMETCLCRLCFSTRNHHINIFSELESKVNVAEIINEHIGKVSVSDDLPKTICIDCWNTTEAFHKFHRSVKMAQTNYLNGLLKCELAEPECQEFFSDEFEEHQVQSPNFMEVAPGSVKLDDLNVEIADVKCDMLQEDLQSETVQCIDTEDIKVNELSNKLNKDSDHDSDNESELLDVWVVVDTNETNKTESATFDYTCDVCKTDMESLKQAIIHYRDEHDIEHGYVKCCGLKFRRQQLIDDHTQWHQNPEIFKCEQCGKLWKTRVKLSMHLLDHKYLKTYTCDMCGKTYPEKRLIEQHLLMHLNSVPCKLCRKRCSTQESLEAHEKLAHNSEVARNVRRQLDELKKIHSKTVDAPIANEIMNKYFEMVCHVCGDDLNSLQQAQFHYMHEHQIPNGYIKCCGIKFMKHKNLHGHIQWHMNPEILKCNICGKMRKTIASLRDHLKTHTHANLPEPKRPRPDNRVICVECNYTFSRKGVLRKHMLVMHGKAISITVPDKKRVAARSIASTENVNKYFDMTCDICSITLASLQHAKMHYMDEHGINDGYIKCCGVKFKVHYQVNDHIKFHLNPDIYKCKICGKHFAKKENLQSHVYSHRVQSEETEYTCAVCDQVFSGKIQFNQHKWKHEERERKQNHRSRAKLFPCRFCINRRFKSEDLRKGHEDRIHLKSEEINTELCEFCAKPCRSRAALRNHIRSIHLDLAPTSERLQCEVCNAWLSNSKCLKRHMEQHTIDPQKCPQCDNVKPNQGALIRHILNVHTQRIHKCHLCDKSFKAAYALRSHVATHTGEKLYKCSFCDTAYVWRTDMYKHQKKTHPEEWSQNRAEKLAARQP